MRACAMATPYHRQARETPAYRWWRLPVAALVILTAYLAMSVVLVLLAAVYFAVSSGSTRRFDTWIDDAGDLDLARLDFFTLDLLGLVLLIPAVLLGVLATGPRPVGYLSSVADGCGGDGSAAPPSSRRWSPW